MIEPKAAFGRERRRRALATIAARLRQAPDDVSVMLPFEEVVRALGRRGQEDLGVQSIPLDSIAGSVDRHRGEFDATTGSRSPARSGTPRSRRGSSRC